jgi:hypothetical protein
VTIHQRVLALAVFAAFAFPLEAQTTLPDAQVGQNYSFTITTNPPSPAGTVYAATNLPAGLSINSASGNISGVATTAGVATGTISITNNGITNNFSYQLTVDPPSGTPAITSASNASGTVGQPFSYTLAASNAPTSYNVGSLPAGLSFSGNVNSPTITGTPTAAGSYTVALSANNGNGIGPTTNLALTIAAAGPVPSITSGTSAQGEPNTSYTAGSPLYTATASNSPTAFAATGLPFGVSIDPATGIMSGTPTVAGIYTVGLTASNANGTGPSTNLTLTIGDLSSLTSSTNLSATSGQTVSFTLSANNSPTSFNVTGLPAGLSANATTGVISGSVAAAGSYSISVSVNNALGTGPSSSIALTVSSPPSSPGGGGGGPGPSLPAPSIVAQPTSLSVSAGGSAAFSIVVAAGSGALTYQWYFTSGSTTTAIAGATSSVLTLTNVTSSNAGTYSVVVTGTGGSTTSAGASVTVVALVTPVSITVQPASQAVTVGTAVTFNVTASGSGAIAYQWQKNGTAIAGATGASYSIANPQQSDAGTYSVVVTGGGASVTSNGAVLTVSPNNVVTVPPPRPINISVRGFSGTGAQSLIIGFVVGGTGQKDALVRAVGPTLASFGVSGVMADPQLTVYSGSTSVAANAGWGGSAALGAVFAQTGAFNLPANSKDSALLTTLNPGPYTAQVTSVSGGTGVVLLEAYDTDSTSSSSRFINISARGLAGTGPNVLTIGFGIAGNTTRTVLIRGIGPTLASFGVGGALANPQLTVFAGSTVVGTNAGWGGSSTLASFFAQVSAFPLPQNSADAAILLTLSPGTYTAQLSGIGGTTGIALIELYDVQ